MNRKSWLDDLVVWGDEDTIVSKAIAPLLYSLIAETGPDAMTEIQLTPSSFNPVTTAILNYYQHRATKIAEDINDETEKQLRAALTEGIAAGEASYDLAARIESVMGNASTMRADRIARTETSRAQNFGDIEAWKQSGVVSGKEWFTAEDEAVCPFCDDLDGKVVDLDDNFFDKGDVQDVTVDDPETGDPKTVSQTLSYDDIPSAPLHVNCRCSQLPVRS